MQEPDENRTVLVPELDNRTPEAPAPSGHGDGEGPQAASRSRPNWKLRVGLGAAALVLCVAAAIWYFRFIAPYESTDNAAIEGHVMPVAPQVAGRIARLAVQDNQEVSKGDLLLEIDARDYEVRLAKAQAQSGSSARAA